MATKELSKEDLGKMIQGCKEVATENWLGEGKTLARDSGREDHLVVGLLTNTMFRALLEGRICIPPE